MRKIIICLLFSTMLLLSCSLNNSKDDGKSVDNKVNEANTEYSSKTNGEENITKTITEQSKEDETTENFKNTSEESTEPSDNIAEENISKKVKNYIINGQEDKVEALKWKWSTTFLDEVDITSLYDEYIAAGGNVENIEDFAKYITLNAPILNNWEELFKKDLYDIYGEEVSKLEHLEGDLYQAYVNKDGIEVPYVVVSARTGYFHG